MLSGEEKFWKTLADLEPECVCKETGADYDGLKGLYILKSFKWDISFSTKEKEIFCNEPDSDILLKEQGIFSRLSFLCYMVSTKDIPLSGQLVRPDNLKGGHLFSQGTHVLPLGKLSERYNDDIEGFLLKGRALNAEQLQYGDASVKLLPVPRVPVTLILWKGDDEFSPRADLLFDSTSELQSPVDILWSIAMMSVLMML